MQATECKCPLLPGFLYGQSKKLVFVPTARDCLFVASFVQQPKIQSVPCVIGLNSSR